MSDEKHHIVSYRTYGLILLALLFLTAISVLVTQIQLATWSMVVALLLAGTKTTLVLAYFMHLKFDKTIYRLATILIIAFLGVIIFITFMDYVFRVV
jgi:cytochrome c oxidase subunit IV